MCKLDDLSLFEPATVSMHNNCHVDKVCTCFTYRYGLGRTTEDQYTLVEADLDAVKAVEDRLKSEGT